MGISTYKNYVDGQFCVADSDGWFDDINPANGEKIAQIAIADKPLIDKAVSAAHRALKGEWGQMDMVDRLACLRKIADAIDARFDDFVQAEIADTGKPLSQARTLDIPRGTANFRIFADLMQADAGESYRGRAPDGRMTLNYSLRKPMGVIAIVAPWNLPFLLATWKLAPALAVGNVVVIKPSEETPASVTLLAEIFDAVGVPAGVFNVVHGFGKDCAGEFLTQHPDIDAITFTGETSTGKVIMQAAAKGVKPISFELGGKNAAIVFADADFDKAVAGIARSTFFNCGQVCLCTERIYVERSIFKDFVVALKQKAEAIKIGDPYTEGTEMGPLVSHGHRDKVLGYFDVALKEGATFVTGGAVPKLGNESDQGAFVMPTIWTGLAEDSTCVKQEIFGPVCHICPFDTEEEAIELANDTQYGLASAIWTENLSRAHRVAPQLETGIVWVNCWFVRDLRTPFGGVKMSGIGREGGRHSLDFYSEPMNICISY